MAQTKPSGTARPGVARWLLVNLHLFVPLLFLPTPVQASCRSNPSFRNCAQVASEAACRGSLSCVWSGAAACQHKPWAQQQQSCRDYRSDASGCGAHATECTWEDPTPPVDSSLAAEECHGAVYLPATTAVMQGTTEGVPFTSWNHDEMFCGIDSPFGAAWYSVVGIGEYLTVQIDTDDFVVTILRIGACDDSHTWECVASHGQPPNIDDHVQWYTELDVPYYILISRATPETSFTFQLIVGALSNGSNVFEKPNSMDRDDEDSDAGLSADNPQPREVQNAEIIGLSLFVLLLLGIAILILLVLRDLLKSRNSGPAENKSDSESNDDSPETGETGTAGFWSNSLQWESRPIDKALPSLSIRQQSDITDDTMSTATGMAGCWSNELRWDSAREIVPPSPLARLVTDATKATPQDLPEPNAYPVVPRPGKSFGKDRWLQMQVRASRKQDRQEARKRKQRKKKKAQKSLKVDFKPLDTSYGFGTRYANSVSGESSSISGQDAPTVPVSNMNEHENDTKKDWSGSHGLYQSPTSPIGSLVISNKGDTSESSTANDVYFYEYEEVDV